MDTISLSRQLKKNGISIAQASECSGVPKTTFYDVFRGRFDGFSPSNARKIMQAWPGFELQWEDLLFYKERFLKPVPPLTEEERAVLMAEVDKVVSLANRHPEARRLVLNRVTAEIDKSEDF